MTYRPYKTGVKSVTRRPELFLHKFTNETALAAALPESWDQTQGLVEIGMMGNDEFGDCVEADYFHGEMFKALVAPNEYEAGFKPASTRFVENIYFSYGRSIGEPGSHPDEGSDPSTWAAYVIKTKHAEFSAELDVVVDGPQDPAHTVDLPTLFQAAVNFRGVALTIECPTQMQQQFDNGEVLSVGPDNQPDPEDGHGIWLCAFDQSSQIAKIATWGKVVECTFEFLTACMTSAWVFGTKQDAEAAGYDFAEWEKAASTMTNFLDAIDMRAAEDFELTENKNVTADSTGLLREVENAIESVPAHIEQAIKATHDLQAKILENAAVDVIEALVKNLIRTYTHRGI